MDPLPWFTTPPIADTTNVVVVGAGLAGCNLAWSLAKRAIPVTLVDASTTVASAASANTRCVLQPHLVRSAGQLNAFNEAAFKHSKNTLHTLKSVGQPVESGFPGVLRLLRKAGTWPALTTATVVDATRASELAGTKLHSPALHFAEAGWVNAASYCSALLATPEAMQTVKLMLKTKVAGIEATASGFGAANRWTIHLTSTDSPETRQVQATSVVICCGAGIKHIGQLAALPLQISSGQTTQCNWPPETSVPKTVICGNQYLIPTDTDITVGATHWRNNEQTGIDPHDDALNIAALQQLVPDLAKTGISTANANAHWRSLRASTPDRFPLVGAVPDLEFYRRAYAALSHGPQHKTWPLAQYLGGLYVLGGLGSRGAGTASLCAELLAEQIAPKRLSPEKNSQEQIQDWLTLLHPARFLIRQLKRTP